MSTAALSRAELQALAKQHGIKANMKNAEIEKALADKGVSLVPVAPSETKPRGLSVRNDNIQTVEQPAAKKKAVKAVAAVPVPAEDDLENVGPIARRTRRSLTKESEQSSVEPEQNQESEAPVARRTRRSATKESEQTPNSAIELPPLPPSTKTSMEPIRDAKLQSSPITMRRRSARLSRSSTASLETPKQEQENDDEAPVVHSARATAGDRSPYDTLSPAASVAGVDDHEEAVDENVGSNRVAQSVSLPKRAAARYVSGKRNAEREEVRKSIENASLAPTEEKPVATAIETAVVTDEERANVSSATKIQRQEELVVEATPQNISISTDSSMGSSEGRRSMRQIRIPQSMRGEKSETTESTETSTSPRPHPIRSVPLLLPPTPENIRKKMDDALHEHKNDLDRLIANYTHAISALEVVPALLQKQKQLLLELERSREENKRLREYITTTD